MILELLEWIATPCSWSARTNGLLAAQIGIRHRARRCRAAWKPHLDACRQFVAEAVGPSPADETLTILGSGHLNDFDLEFLQRRFKKITLVDAVHPIEIQIRASFSRGRLRLIASDLSSPNAEIEDLVSRSSWTISSCLLSQLSLFSTEPSPTLLAARVGDTITLIKADTGGAAFTATEALPGFKEIKPQVFAGLYPTEANQYDALRDSLEKLKLNDASLHYEPEVSQALGFGFRCGFLGLLHMEIVQERLEREFDQDLITTAPSVVYQVVRADGEVVLVENPAKMPDQGKMQEIREPIVTVHLYMPQEYVGAVMTLANQKRGMQLNMAYHGRQVMLTYDMPLGEIVLDFFDKLKSVSRGYASMDYEFKEFRASDVVKVDILLNGEKVDALSIIVHRTQSQYRGRAVVAKMREIISRQMFDVAIQAAIGSNIIARESIKALRKNVLAKCYGGDISRKRKLLEKQKAGKKRMKQIGSVEVPQEAFLAILQVED